MGDIAVSNLAYAHPGGDLLFSDVSFRLPAGRHAGLIGDQRRRQVHAAARRWPGELERRRGRRRARRPGAVHGPGRRRRQTASMRELLLSVAPARVRDAGLRDARAPSASSRAGDDGRPASGSARRSAPGRTSAATSSRASGTPPAGGSSGAGLDEVGDRAADQVSGGERKRLVLELLFASDAPGAAARRARQLPRRAGQARARGADRARRRRPCC